MWKASAGIQSYGESKNNDEDDNWETDPDFVNDVTEEEQRWGSKTVQGSGRTAGAIDMQKLREETAMGDAQMKQQQQNDGPKAAYGYGGKFGVQEDRMDKSAMGHDYVAPLQQHESQRDYATGFGGKFGVQSDRQDKSAVGWDHIEKAQKHQSQKDYSVGFGGKFGVQTDRQDKSAVGWEHHETLPQHDSQVDHKKGFGGKYGLQTDRVDKSALSFDEAAPEKVGTAYEKVKPDIGTAKPSSLRAKFEEMAKGNDNIAKAKAIEEKKRREEREKKELEREQARRQAEELRVKEDLRVKSTTVGPSGHDISQVHAEEKVTVGPGGDMFDDVYAEELTSLKEEHSSPQQTPPSVYQEQGPPPVVHQKEAPSVVHQEEAPAQPTALPECQEAVGGELEDVFATGDTPQTEEDQEDSGYTAVALYDYQAAADDEISFDPDDAITNIEMIDEGWWRGYCKGQYGLFPANYVQLQQQQQ